MNPPAKNGKASAGRHEAETKLTMDNLPAGAPSGKHVGRSIPLSLFPAGDSRPLRRHEMGMWRIDPLVLDGIRNLLRTNL